MEYSNPPINLYNYNDHEARLMSGLVVYPWA